MLSEKADFRSFLWYIKYQHKGGVPLDTILNNLGYKREEKNMPDDVIGRPNHYCEGRKYEPKDVIRDWGLNFNLGNTVKYVARNGRKAGESALKDLKKARQYLDFEIEAIEKDMEEKENGSN